MTLIEDRIAELGTRISQLNDPAPPFEILVGWSKDYDGIFSSNFEGTEDARSILDHALRCGRVLVTGRGGGAKTVVLTRVAKLALEAEVFTAFVTLKDWTAPDYAQWNDLQGFSNRIAYLLEQFSGLRLLPRDLQVLDPTRPRLLIVDGLNEVSMATGQQILNALDEYARFSLKTSVLVSDRLVRRDFIRAERWEIACILPLSAEQIRAQIEANPAALMKYQGVAPEASSILATPYFLNALLTGGDLARTTSDEMAEYFQRHALAQHEVDAVAEASYRLYASATRAFSWTQFKGLVGVEVADRVVAAGALVVSGDVALFDHHLKHDYLVSRYVSRHPELWNSETFNTITFHASSFETIRMAMEQIDVSSNADDLLRKLYDWNIYGAGYSIAEGRDSHVSKDMQIIILAMFAERRWDRVIATANRASDTLSLIQIREAADFLSAESLDDVFKILIDMTSLSSLFEEWRDLFTLPSNSEAPSILVETLRSGDSVFGWTTANVLKRLNCGAEQQRVIRSLLTSSDSTVQWRAAHVLGSFPSEENFEALVALLMAETVDVRFGAVRSLVEMASRGPFELAKSIFEKLSESVNAISEYPRVLAEFERALLIRKDCAPSGWTRLASISIAALQSENQGSENRDRWDRTLLRMLDLYGI
jgi:hypothetical protein